MKAVSIFLNDVWHSAAIDFGCVGSRILLIKFKFSRLKFLWLWGTVPIKKIVKKGTGSRMTSTGL